MRVLLMVGLGIGLLVQLSSAQEGVVRQELKKLEGTWSVVGAERHGKPEPEEELKKRGLKFLIIGDMFTLLSGGKDEVKGILKVDPSRTPRRMDLVLTTPDGKEIAIAAIYKLEGETLTLSTGEPGQKAPAEFKTREDSQHEVSIFKRVKK